jgi:hypothetical protein
MTIKTGAQRHTPGPAGVGPTPGVWIAHRQPDAVRVAALANAVEAYLYLAPDDPPDDPAAEILDLARIFEAYLDPAKEGHGS